ncbi:DUF58 domain-containing protein [Niveibacterium sp. SC-1]|uniref:DUF58 domain-containing protein n=1 Tax=Niveibacterium sp. SC-1 TaxID=3135646 RepID=UPI00311D486A
MSTAPIEALGTVRVDLPHLMRLEYRARGLSFLPTQPRGSVLAGRHGSRMRGRGLNFEEIRAYVPGDDTRNIDWKVSLRTGTPQVRAYTEERDRPALFVVDQRLNMFFGSRRAMKSVVAAELAALGAWMAFRSGDRAGAVVFDDTHVERIRPHRSRARIERMCSAIVQSNDKLSAESNVVPAPQQLDRALEDALQLAPHDHLVCVISDFHGAGERTRRLLRALAAHNDVVAALIYDPAALQLQETLRIVVSGGELQVELDLTKGSVREPLTRHFSGRLESVGDLLRHSGVPCLALDTEAPTLDQLRRFLGVRPLTQRRFHA